jgi:hypothetical protein
MPAGHLQAPQYCYRERGAAMSPQFKITAFKSIRAGALIGFVDVTLPSGMILHRCSIFTKDDKAWASPPSKQVISRDGTIQRTADGKTRYEPTVSFKDRWTQERWSTAVIEALRAEHPEALS